MTTKCYLNAMGILCAAGDSPTTIKENLTQPKTHFTMTNEFGSTEALPLGLYHGELPTIPLAHKKWQSRNNQFALAAVKQIETQLNSAIKRFGNDRVAVVIGTSTSGIAESEPATREWLKTNQMPADYDYGLQEMGATAQFIAEVLDLHGPVYGISTACSSGAKALATARRLIRMGICDAVIAGGVDTLCQLTVQGFSSLQAVSNETCKPFSLNRDGINIGEGAALFLVTAEPKGVELLGVGEGSDAHHISAPDPTGDGAVRTMTAALADAKLKPDNISYVNLHGTATKLNDQMESLAMSQVFGSTTLCSSTKPFTGHTLGAAGAVEAAICWLMLEGVENKESNPFVPIHLWDNVQDPELPMLNLVTVDSELPQTMDYIVSNSFAFGGNNISLLLGKV